MILTERQLNILNHCIVDGQAWADHVEKTFDAEKAQQILLEKVSKYESDYDEQKAKGNYLNRVQRDEKEQEELAARRKAKEDGFPYNIKRQKEYPSLQELVVALYDEEDKAEIIKRRAEVKAKYPKE